MTRTPIWVLVSTMMLSIAAVAQEGPSASPSVLSASQQTASGNLAIRAVQGTVGGAKPAGSKVEVHLFHRGQPFQKIDGTLDDLGLLVLSDLPVAMGIRPLVRIEHGGVTYQDTGPEMTPESPDASVEVVIYETTTDRPAWRVASRQAIVTPAIDRLLVSESVYVDNPGDRTWLGGAEATNGKLTTVALDLPALSENVTLDTGFHGWCCTTYEQGRLAVQMPLMPGRSVYQFTYEVPTTEGRGVIALSAGAGMDELAVIIPESGIAAEPVGLTAGSVQMSESGPLRLYVGRGIGAGERPSLSLTGLPRATPQSGADRVEAPVESPGGGPGLSAWLIGGTAVAAIGIALGVFVMRRGE